MTPLRILATVVLAALVGWAAGLWLASRHETRDWPDESVSAPSPADSAAALPVPDPGPAEASAQPAGNASAGVADSWAEPASTAAPGQAATIELDDIEALLAALPARERDSWLADTDALGRLVEEESALRSVLAAASANGALDDPLTALLVQRARDRTLADLYLARVVRANLSPAFPSRADIDALIQQQPERFRLPERVPVWQIFLPLPPAEAGEAALAATEKRAQELSSALRKGQADFAAAALSHSAHTASRQAGGFMGLLAVPELLPEVRERIATLESGKVSEPVRTEQGFHILKVGQRQPAEALAEDDARALARQELLREATAAIRKAAVDKIRAGHQVRVVDIDIDAWHQRLLSRDWSVGTAAADAGGATADDESMEPRPAPPVPSGAGASNDVPGDGR
jgi:peptidylprolyl isomerase